MSCENKPKTLEDAATQMVSSALVWVNGSGSGDAVTSDVHELLEDFGDVDFDELDVDHEIAEEVREHMETLGHDAEKMLDGLQVWEHDHVDSRGYLTGQQTRIATWC